MRTVFEMTHDVHLLEICRASTLWKKRTKQGAQPSFVPNHLRSLVGIQLMEDDMARAATTAAKKNERPSQPEGYYPVGRRNRCHARLAGQAG